MNMAMLPGTILAMTTGAALAAPVSVQRAWSETYPVSAPARLEVKNIWGNVTVRRGNAGEISLSVTEDWRAPDQERFDRAAMLYRLDVVADATGLSLKVGDQDERWYRRDPCRGCRVDYQFEIAVPEGTEVDVGTVVDGRVSVSGIGGNVSAKNVNGPIRLDGIRDCIDVDNVNGDVTIGYGQAPLGNCRIKTINGNVTLDVPGGSGVDLALDLLNGELVSELPVDALPLPATVERSEENGRTSWSVRQKVGVRLGGGGPVYTVTSMNGDVRVRKQ